MYERNRNLVTRADGRPVNVARPRGQLFVCANNCCCGRTEDGFAPVNTELFHAEWERRRLRNIVHLTIGGCLGPCALANVVLLLFDGQALWFHSLNSDALVLTLYDYAEQMLDAGGVLPPPPALAPHHFTASAWQPRPDGRPVDDYRPRRRVMHVRPETDPTDGLHGRALADVLRRDSGPHPPDPISRSAGTPLSPRMVPMLREGGALDGSGAAAVPQGNMGDSCDVAQAHGGAPPAAVDRVVADMEGAAAAPRKNGELVFEAPWQGRAFGMAVALNEQGLYPWDDFRDRLIGEIAAADAADDPSGYYERWLAAFERVLTEKGIVSRDEIDERTFQFEFGERDDVF